MSKIQFDLEEFKKFLEEFDYSEYDNGCRAKYEEWDHQYRLNDKGEIIYSRFGKPLTFRGKFELVDTEEMIKGEVIDD